MWETWVRSLGWEDPLEKGKVTHSSILAWRIPWIIQSMRFHAFNSLLHGCFSLLFIHSINIYLASKKKKRVGLSHFHFQIVSNTIY